MRPAEAAAAALLGVALVAPASAAVAAPDSGAPAGPCVTKREFRAVEYGMAKARVHRIFDTIGWRSNIETNRLGQREHRKYKACSGGDAYIVQYIDWRRDPDGFEVTRKFR